MKRTLLTTLIFGILFLFFIQMAGTLVESVYVLDLMNTSLDEKALGLLFFFSPAVLLPFRKKLPGWLAWAAFGLLFLGRGLAPYLPTSGRMLASGAATGAALILLILLLAGKGREDDEPYAAGTAISAGLALATALSVLLRTLNYSLDYSLVRQGGWAGWALGLGLGWCLTRLEVNIPAGGPTRRRGLTPALMGVFLAVTLVYFAFSAPAVIARWTEGNYALIVTLASLLSAGWAWLALSQPRRVERLSPTGLLLWNLAFTLCLTATLFAHRIPFPQTPESAPVVVGAPAWQQQAPLWLTMLLFPIIFLDLRLFAGRIRQAAPSPADLLPGMLAGSGALVLLVLTSIFTNVWAYVEPVSPFFRNKFWLPYLLLAGGLSLLARPGRPGNAVQAPGSVRSGHWGWSLLLAAIVLGTAASILTTGQVRPGDADKQSLRVMTYNIQQANDGAGERAFERQLALIRQAAPDVLALQESDSARIALNNNDYVRYYAGKLGYYAYYGPRTVTGTFGTALLSRYPLQNPRSVFSYSDQDEIGTAEAEVEAGGRTFSIYNVHPDGSDTAKLVFARRLLERARGKADVIILGDFNLRDDEEAYQLIERQYTNAWVSVYPTKISPDGTDMSGRNRIDHIFVSPGLGVREPVYRLPPESATDHPVHWAEVVWEE